MGILEEDLELSAKKISKEFYNSTFFITGGTGLIGSIFIKTLLKANVMLGANIKTLALVRNKEKAASVFADFNANKFLHFVEGDVTEKIKIDEKIDYIVHAASNTTSKTLSENPVESSKTSLLGTFSVLDFAKEKNVKSMVYLSSMEAFGSCSEEEKRLCEEDLGYVDLSKTRSCYPEGKRMCELLCTSYAQEYSVPVKSARLAQVFGPGISKNESRVFAQFVKSALNGKDIVLHTDGTSWGNYSYTRDTINAIFTLLEKGENGETYTVANEESSIQIKDMALLVIDALKAENTKLVFDIPEDSKKFGYAAKTIMKLSSQKLQKLGWKPEVSLKETYLRLSEYMKENNIL